MFKLGVRDLWAQSVYYYCCSILLVEIYFFPFILPMWSVSKLGPKLSDEIPMQSRSGDTQLRMRRKTMMMLRRRRRMMMMMMMMWRKGWRIWWWCPGGGGGEGDSNSGHKRFHMPWSSSFNEKERIGWGAGVCRGRKSQYCFENGDQPYLPWMLHYWCLNLSNSLAMMFFAPSPI